MIAREPGRILLAGPLTQETVRAFYDSGLQPAGQSALEVNLSKVETVDSAAVSLLLSWLREAQRNNLSLNFTGVPDNLLSLARVYGVADMLQLPREAGAGA